MQYLLCSDQKEHIQYKTPHLTKSNMKNQNDITLKMVVDQNYREGRGYSPLKNHCVLRPNYNIPSLKYI